MRRIIFSSLLVLSFLAPGIVLAAEQYQYLQTYLGQIGWGEDLLKDGDGTGVTVAVIDQGVDSTHPDLQGAFWTNDDEIPGNGIDDDKNGYVDDIGGWNFFDNTNDLSPKGIHGTLVSGIIAARHNGAGIAGLAPGVKIMPLVACDGAGECAAEAVAEAMEYASKNGADIINISLNRPGEVGYSTEYDHVIKEAYGRGVFIAVAAGNGERDAQGYNIGFDLDSRRSSLVSNDVDGLNTVFGVGADGQFGIAATWSNYGALSVDAFAPGAEILTTTPRSFSGGYAYEFVNGTSFATPVLSAAAALLKSRYPYLKNYEIADILKQNRSLNVRDALYNGIGKRLCSVSPFKESIAPGAVLRLKAKSLVPSLSLSLVSGEGETVPVVPLVMDESTLAVIIPVAAPAGTYMLSSATNACTVGENAVEIKGESTVQAAAFLTDLRPGQRSPDVARLQAFLNSLGYAVTPLGKETSYFGSATKKALVQYQRDAGLPATGLFGPMTRAKVNASL